MKTKTILTKLHRLEKQFRASAREQIDLSGLDIQDPNPSVVSIGVARASFRDGVASALIDAANQLKTVALALSKKPKSILAQSPPPPVPVPPQVVQITEAVCDHYYVTPAHIASPSRKASICLPRHVIFYFCRENKMFAITDLAVFFGVDHTSVSYGERVVRDRCSVDPKFAAEIAALKNTLTHRA